jgi:hypothetical protein
VRRRRRINVDAAADPRTPASDGDQSYSLPVGRLWTSLAGQTVDIPPDKMDLAFRLLTPDQYFRGGVHDFIHRIVAEARITHGDGTRTYVMVRDAGDNPAAVSVDGKNYFYARNDPDVHNGALDLIRLVTEETHRRKAERQPKP